MKYCILTLNDLYLITGHGTFTSLEDLVVNRSEASATADASFFFVFFLVNNVAFKFVLVV